ncbi:MAG TPA: hypothetical protein VF403_14190 [Kofleriaceae bacterium]
MRSLAFVVLAACGAAVPELPSRGGPPWVELQSEHFTLWTDASVARGGELIRLMEYLHQVIFGVAFPNRSLDGRSFVLGLRDQAEVNAYVPDMFQAFATPEDNPLMIPMIVLSAEPDERSIHVVTHELSHVISAVAVHKQPVWFAEGLAEFFETVILDVDKASVVVGQPFPIQVAATQQLQLVPGDQLLACKEYACRDHAFYMTSAVLFSYLANTHPDQLLRYEDELANNNPRAWDVFGIAPGDIDRTLRAWMIEGRHQVWNYKASLVQPKIAQRVLAETEIIAARAFLSYSFHVRSPGAHQALAADATNLMLRLIDFEQTKQVTVADARATAQANPHDWRAWWLVATALRDTSDEANAARAQACTLAKSNPANMLPAKFCPLDGVPGAPEHRDQPVVPE